MKIVMQSKKYINLSVVLDLNNYSNSINRWFQFRKMFENVNQHLIHNAVNQYLSIVKPVIHIFSQGTIDQTQSSKNVIQPHMASIRILICFKYKKSNYYTVTYFHNSADLNPYDILVDNNQIIQKIQDSEVQKLLQPPTHLLQRLNLLQPPFNKEFQHWSHTIAVRQMNITSIIVKGKGVGTKDLGMPTANLQVTEQISRKLLEYPNGIYIVTFNIDNKESHMAVMSLGTNPHYQNFSNSRCVEAFILHDFGDKKIYGSQVSITVHRLIRLEGKFPSFDSFLHAMHNDIYVGKKYSHEYLSKTNL